MGLDRFEYGLSDSQNEEAIATCEVCGAEIYPGEEVRVFEDHLLCDDDNCLKKFLTEKIGLIEKMPVEEALGRV